MKRHVRCLVCLLFSMLLMFSLLPAGAADVCPDCGRSVTVWCATGGAGSHCSRCAVLCSKCRTCISCSGRERCPVCGLCDVCCRGNSIYAGCVCGMCVKDSDFSDHLCPGCDCCPGDEALCSFCGLCEDCCELNRCEHGICIADTSAMAAHTCVDCGRCFDVEELCETCRAEGIVRCRSCCEQQAEASEADQDDKMPHITAQPRNVAAVYDAKHNNTVTLSVSASGENLRYTWYVCNDVKKPSVYRTCSVSSPSGQCTLMVDSSWCGKQEEEPDFLRFYVVVSNRYGSVTSEVRQICMQHNHQSWMHVQDSDSKNFTRKYENYHWPLCSCSETFEGTHYGEDLTLLVPHTYGAWKPVTGEENLKSRTCQVCGYTAYWDPTAPPAHGFTDLEEDAWYYEAVDWAVTREIAMGTSETLFSPNEVCTRGQVVALLWRAAGSPKPVAIENPFKDVKEGSYYYDAVMWAVRQGITDGAWKKKFMPDDIVTRGQMVTLLYRAAGMPLVKAGNTSFKDVPDDSYYADAVDWAVEQGITNGMSKHSFRPDDGCTRGQVMTSLYRANHLKD